MLFISLKINHNSVSDDHRYVPQENPVQGINIIKGSWIARQNVFSRIIMPALVSIYN